MITAHGIAASARYTVVASAIPIPTIKLADRDSGETYAARSHCCFAVAVLLP